MWEARDFKTCWQLQISSDSDELSRKKSFSIANGNQIFSDDDGDLNNLFIKYSGESSERDSRNVSDQLQQSVAIIIELPDLHSKLDERFELGWGEAIGLQNQAV